MKSAATVFARLPITVLIAVRNEELNIARCLRAARRAERIIVVDSGSTDRTAAIAEQLGAEVVQFRHVRGYPKKRQWALDTLDIRTPWIFLLDADEVVPESLWDEVASATSLPVACDAYLVTKGFHFLGKRFRHGGFSFEAILLFRTGRARFEELVDVAETELDMEVHERLLVDGRIGRLRTPLVHDDFKGLQAYIERHNRYSTWEAHLRHSALKSGTYGTERSIRPRLFGDPQARRRFLKRIAMVTPGEPALWFLYHYLARLGFLEGREGLIASAIRAYYISLVRAKVYELERGSRDPRPTAPVSPTSDSVRR